MEEGNVGVAEMEQDGWLLPSFLAITSIDSLLATISTAALDEVASMTALDDDDEAEAATATDGGDGVGRCAATETPPPPPRLLSGAFTTNDPVESAGDASLVETSFILMPMLVE